MAALEKVFMCVAAASFAAWLAALVCGRAGPWLRRQPAKKIILMTAMMGFGSMLTQKPTGGSGGVSTQTGITPQKPSVVLTIIPGQLPEWWKWNPADTDGDGIPDLWEIWTGTDPLVADSHLDLTGCGLTSLEKFWNQLDPRVPSTMGDLSDCVKIQFERDPLARETFEVEEPDENNDGVIDIWEGSGYRYGFVDANGNGFDDRYELVMPHTGAGNADVELRVLTSRSAALLWGGESLVLASGAHCVNIRVPFEEDTRVALVPAPEGVDVEGPWKAALAWRWNPARHPDNDTTRLFRDNETDRFLEGPEDVGELATILGAPPTRGGPAGLGVDYAYKRVIVSNETQSACVRHGGDSVFHATTVGTVLEPLEWFIGNRLWGIPDGDGRVFDALSTGGLSLGDNIIYCGENGWRPIFYGLPPPAKPRAHAFATLHVYECPPAKTNVLGAASRSDHTPTNVIEYAASHHCVTTNLNVHLGYKHVDPVATSNLWLLAWYTDPNNYPDADAYKLTQHTIKNLIWSQGGSINLASLLASNAQPYMDKVYFIAQQRLRDVWGLDEIYQNGKTFEVENHVLKFDDKPKIRKPTIYHVELRYRDKSEVFDRLWVVINNPDAQTIFNEWVAQNADNSWMASLPPVYPAIQMGGYNTPVDPEPGAPHSWEEPKRKTSLLHHSAGVVRSEMLTEQLPGGHANQAWYDTSGMLIEDPPFLAGRPKKFAQNSSDNLLNMRYNENEMHPFVLAAQLDGNPVHAIIHTEFVGTGSTMIGGNEVTLGGAPMEFFQNLTSPCIHLGDNLNTYLDKRPAHPTGKLNP